ncbi:MAG: AEC family transporter [Lachnospiraceae bacterium]|nr:AEC family transporter [Lachnospiraceae bacterium]MBQ9561969.1 AEC family transporter [Lachnospiraceae bacterium]
MENLLFSLGVTMPVFLLVVLGYVVRRLGIVDEIFAKKTNDFVFKFVLPVTLYKQLATTDFMSRWDTGFALYCAAATIGSIFLMILLARFLAKPSQRGEFIQGGFRASQALLGLAYLTNLYGSADYVPAMLIVTVLIYNFAAVIILMAYAPENAGKRSTGRREALRKVGKGILTNPLIIGIVCGILWSVLQIPMVSVYEKVVTDVAKLATPLGLIGMGASLNLKEMSGELGCAVRASFMKLIGLGLIFTPIAVWLGFLGEMLATILVMLASPTTVSGYVMAKNAGYDGVLTSDIVILTTVASAFTMTGWIWALRSLGLI